MRNHWPSRLLILLACFALAGCGSGSSNSAGGGGGGGEGIPATLFGLHDAWDLYPPQVKFGAARIWDNGSRWDQLWQNGDCIPGQSWSGGPCTASNNNWHWSPLDRALSAIKSRCPACDVILTFGGIAAYANHCDDTGIGVNGICPYPLDGACGNTRPWGCYLPSDLNTDGSGTDNYIITWFQFEATHIANLDSTKYATVKYWDFANEYDRNPCVDGGQYDNTWCTNSSNGGAGGNPNGNYTFIATYSQLHRIWADMVATIGPILPGSDFLEGNTAGPSPRVNQNILYCSANPSTSCGCPAGTVAGCSGVCAPGKCKGAEGLHALANGITFHGYVSDGTGEGEQIISKTNRLRGVLQGSDVGLPIWMDEGSWQCDKPQGVGKCGIGVPLSDYDMQGGFVARYWVSCWSAGLARCYEYRYDSDCNKANGRAGAGTLWWYTDPNCLGPDKGLWWSGKAYNQTYNWLVGSTLTNSCSNIGSNVWTCNLTNSAGTQEQIVWWDEPNSTTWCQGSTPITHGSCDHTSYAYPSQYGHYQTIDPHDGTQALSGGTVEITGQPILLMP